jgi:hypothetical protein
MRSVRTQALAVLTLVATVAATLLAAVPASAELSGWDSFTFGNPGDVPLVAPWLGGGVDQIGVYRPSTQTFYKRECSGGTCSTVAQVVGNPGDIPIAGSWDGGYAGIGVFRPSTATFYLFSPGVASPTVVRYGNPGDVPIVGDWNGDGITDVGVYRPGNQTFYQDVPAQYHYLFGNPGDKPFIGDWTGSLVDDIGVDRPSSGGALYMRVNAQSTVQCISAGGSVVLAGRWLGGGRGVLDGIGYFNPQTAQWDLYNSYLGPSGKTLC